MKKVNIQDLFSNRKDTKLQCKRRTTKQVNRFLEELTDRLWYYRTLVYELSLVSPTENQINDLKIASAGKVRIEKEYGKETLAPLDDWNLGYLNGYLAGVRWVCGEDHNAIDT